MRAKKTRLCRTCHCHTLVVNQPKRFVSSLENERASSRAMFAHAPTMGDDDQQPTRNTCSRVLAQGTQSTAVRCPKAVGSETGDAGTFNSMAVQTDTVYERQLDLGRTARFAKPKNAVEYGLNAGLPLQDLLRFS
jgi:hypothetical protein